MARKKKHDLTATEREPVIIAFVVGAVPIVASFVLGVIRESGSHVPVWIIVALTGVGALTTALGALWSRLQVTPTAKFRSDTRAR